jgi:uncharacterized membrane protein
MGGFCPVKYSIGNKVSACVKPKHTSGNTGMIKKNYLFLLMSVFSQTFFAFVSSHFMTLSFFSAWHKN